MALPAVAHAPGVGQPWGGAALGVGHGGRASLPNIGLEPTRNSLRSYLAAAIARGSGPALDGAVRILKPKRSGGELCGFY